MWVFWWVSEEHSRCEQQAAAPSFAPAGQLFAGRCCSEHTGRINSALQSAARNFAQGSLFTGECLWRSVVAEQSREQLGRQHPCVLGSREGTFNVWNGSAKTLVPFQSGCCARGCAVVLIPRFNGAVSCAVRRVGDDAAALWPEIMSGFRREATKPWAFCAWTGALGRPTLPLNLRMI